MPGGPQNGVVVLQVEDADDAGNVDAGGHQGDDACDPGEIVGAVTARAPPVRAGLGRPRRSHSRIDWMGAPEVRPPPRCRTHPGRVRVRGRRAVWGSFASAVKMFSPIGLP